MTVDDQRQAILDHLLEGSRRFFHRSMQLGGDRQWAEVDLTMTQLKVLFLVVSLGGSTMGQIARSVGMTLSTATGVADRLVAQAFVRRVNDPDNRRLVWLYPTEKATELVDRFNQIGEAQLRRLTRYLSLEELSLVARAQDILFEAMSRIPTDESPAAGVPEPSGPWDE
jgi:DNA-binding MarR family transcriptional regulator